MLLLNTEELCLCCFQGTSLVYGQEVKRALISRECEGGGSDQNCGYLTKNDGTKRSENSGK